MSPKLFLFPIFLMCLFFVPPKRSFAQGQEEKLCFYNVGMGALTSGIGAVINIKGESWKSCFFRGLWQGSIGGFVNYTSKKSLYLAVNNRNFVYALPARVLNCAGNSVIQNAARNRPFLQHWSFEYLLLRFDIALPAQKKFRLRLLPEAVAASILAARQSRLDLPVTLQTGTMVFTTNHWVGDERGTSGVNYGRALIYQENRDKYRIVAHEMIHEFQYREMLVANAFFQSWAEKMKNSGFKKIFTNYVYPDVPYFGLVYLTEGLYRGERASRNFFELEAERFSTNRFVRIR